MTRSTVDYRPANVASGGVRLLCLPGTMCPPTIFAPLAEALPAAVTVAPWLEWDQPHEMRALAESVLELVAELAPVVLVGHSTGGVIALLSAIDAAINARRAGGVLGVITCGTGANTAGHGDIDAILDNIRRNWGTPLWTAFARRSIHREPDVARMAELIAYPARLDPDAVVQALQSQRATDLVDDLSRIDVPALVVQGTHDKARDLRHARELVDGIPDAELLELDCGHTPSVEVPEAFADAVRDWLTRKITT